jgi:GT2 family glycosyltransferase
MTIPPRFPPCPKTDVSIVIVCMNNLTDLFPCLESITKHTCKVSYEIIVVAYLFSDSNLALLKETYPTVTIIESNDIRGFSENNNLALRKATSRYCMILNDDIYFDSPVIDSLVESFRIEPKADFISPVIIDRSGRISGRPPADIMNFILSAFFGITHTRKQNRKYIDQEGIFQTYNIAGCAFMVKTEVLSKLGFFNEDYFFTPEDIELSTLANSRGYSCYVSSSDIVYHKQGTTFRKTIVATFPAMQKGLLLFHSRYTRWPQILLKMITLIGLINRLIYWSLRCSTDAQVHRKRYRNAIGSILTTETPKEIFLKYYCNS